MRTLGDGGNAFPCDAIGRDKDGEYRIPTAGMTLRDYFAAKALQGFASQPTTAAMREDPDPAKSMAEGAYILADAMLKARES